MNFITSSINSCFGTPGSEKTKIDHGTFNEKRDALGEVVHKQALSWFEKAECQPSDRLNYMDCSKINRQTGKVTKGYVDIDKVLANTKVDYQKIINNLNKTKRAAYEFYLNKAIQDYKQPSLQTPANMIKDMENITNLEDSAILKVATLHFLQNALIDNAENKSMMKSKYADWWVEAAKEVKAEQKKSI